MSKSALRCAALQFLQRRLRFTPPGESKSALRKLQRSADFG
jgi:hypothetical protein